MDHSHHILTDILDRKILLQLPEGGKLPARHEIFSDLDAIAKMIMASQKFDVSSIRPTFNKNLIITAADALHNGMLRMPFDVCFFDFGSAKNTNVATDSPIVSVGACSLVVKDDDLFKIYAFVQRRRGSTEKISWCTFPLTLSARNGQPMDAAFYANVLKSCKHLDAGSMPKYIKDVVLDCAQMTLSSIVCINTDSVKMTEELAPPRLNIARAKRRKVPLSDHTVVTIDISALSAAASGQGGTHSSPRLHWRRGHIRRLPSGDLTEVRACLVGSLAAGMVTHDYKVIDGSARQEEQ